MILAKARGVSLRLLRVSLIICKIFGVDLL